MLDSPIGGLPFVKMEAEIVSRGVLSPGLVSSTLSYTLLGKDESAKEKGVKEVCYIDVKG